MDPILRPIAIQEWQTTLDHFDYPTAEVTDSKLINDDSGEPDMFIGIYRRTSEEIIFARSEFVYN